MNGARNGWRGLMVLAVVIYGCLVIGMSAGERPVSKILSATGPMDSETDRLATVGQIDINRAGPATLELLPGIGPQLARAIVGERERHGSYGNVAGLERVRGIGPKKVAAFRQYLCAEPGTPCRN